MKRIAISSLLLAGSLGAAAVAQMSSPASDSMSKPSSQVTVKLAALHGSNETGTAVLSQTGKGLVVTLTLDPAPAAPQPAHIHKGTCAKLNPAPAYPLQSVTAGSTSMGTAAGTSTTTLRNVTLEELTKGQYAINVHKSAAGIKTYVACGDLRLANPTGATQ